MGLNAIILKDTHTGTHSIVAAEAVVKGDFLDNSLIMGNPATIVLQFDPAKFKE